MDNKYYEFLGDLVNDMGSRDLTVGSYRSIFDHIYYVSFYRKRLLESETPEQTSLARWSLSDARVNLDHIMQVLCFSDSMKMKIRYIAESPLSCVRL